jgi:transcriptional regulator with XRE-family HTH domain
MHFDSVLFSAAVYQKRTQARLKLRHVANQIGLSASTLSRIERGKNDNPDLLTFVLLCNWLERDPASFFVGSAEGVASVTTVEQIEVELRACAELGELGPAIAEVLRLIRERV